MNALQTLQAQLAAINSQIATEKSANKAMVKLQACKLNARSAPKYFDLQRAYMDAVTRK